MDQKKIRQAKKFFEKLIADGYIDQNAFDRTCQQFGGLTAQEISIATNRAYQDK
jgi:hypothetical protein